MEIRLFSTLRKVDKINEKYEALVNGYNNSYNTRIQYSEIS